MVSQIIVSVFRKLEQSAVANLPEKAFSKFVRISYLVEKLGERKVIGIGSRLAGRNAVEDVQTVACLTERARMICEVMFLGALVLQGIKLAPDRDPGV